MTYVLVDEKGFLADLATNLGLTELANFVALYPGLPASKQMMRDGYTADPEKVELEMLYILDVAGDRLTADLKSVIDAMIGGLRKAHEVAIIVQ